MDEEKERMEEEESNGEGRGDIWLMLGMKWTCYRECLGFVNNSWFYFTARPKQDLRTGQLLTVSHLSDLLVGLNFHIGEDVAFWEAEDLEGHGTVVVLQG